MLAREEGKGIDAAILLWKALICGEGKAAYPLFEMLRDGENGVDKNSEISKLILSFGKYAKQAAFEGVKGVTPSLDITLELGSLCASNQKVFGEKLITPTTIALQQKTANKILDTYHSELSTRIQKEPMVSVFTPHGDLDDFVVLAGTEGEGSAFVLT